MNIEISNLSPMPFEADWEYTIGPMGENWKKSVESGDVYYHFSDGWRKTISGDDWVVYARPKPEPEPTETCESLRDKNMSLSQEVEYLKSTIESTNGIAETCERLQERLLDRMFAESETERVICRACGWCGVIVPPYDQDDNHTCPKCRGDVESAECANASPSPEPEEHSCGGPREACMTPGCQECGMKPKPKPEPCIDMPIEWKIYPTVYVSVVSGNSSRRVADIGLVHRQDGHEYRLARFLYSDGTSLRFSADDNLSRDIKATHARFYLVAE